MTRIGYGRVSTGEQTVQPQTDRLLASGCEPGNIFTDEGISGKVASRPGWDACQAFLRKGDTLVVVKLDRVGRSVTNLIQVANSLRDRGVGLICLDQQIDTTSAMGQLFYTILAAFAEFERNLISERTKDGLAATKARGRNGGRKPVLKPYQVEHARALLDARPKRHSVTQVAAELGVSRQTLYRALEAAR